MFSARAIYGLDRSSGSSPSHESESGCRPSSPSPVVIFSPSSTHASRRIFLSTLLMVSLYTCIFYCIVSLHMELLAPLENGFDLNLRTNLHYSICNLNEK